MRTLQSEKSKKAGKAPPTVLLLEFLNTSYGDFSDIFLLEEDMNFNSRAASLLVSFSLFLSHMWRIMIGTSRIYID